MKKITLFSFAIAAISLASCTKTRTCHCTGTTTTVETQTGTITSGPTTTTSDEEYSEELPNVTQATAEGKADCISRKKTYTETAVNGGTTTKDEITEDFTCTIK